MKSIFNFKKALAIVLTLVMGLTLLLATGCDKKPDETPAPTTPVVTPESTPADTPAETPEETPAPGKEFNISYDLDGGIDGGNPTVYNNASDLKLIVPVKVGYDFIGWTGTGITEPQVSVTVAKGTEGDLSFKANWAENGDFSFTIDKTTGDTLGKVFFGNAKAAIVINYSINASNKLVSEELQKFFEKKKQIVKTIRDDNLAYNSTKYDFMFYFGMSDTEPAKEFISTLNPAQYGIAVNDDSLCFVGWTEAGSAAAGDIFYEILEHVVSGGSISDFAGGRYVGQLEDQVGEDVPMIEDLDSGTDVGEGAMQLYTLDSTKAAYDAYLAKLEAVGYEKYTENVMAGKVYVSTYVKDNTVVTVQFSNGDPNGKIDIVYDKSGMTADRSLRVIIEPLSNTALPSLEKPEDADAKVTVSSVTQMSPHNLCVVIQLSNGHFIVFDSGNNGTQKVLSDFLRDKAPDGKPVVEAWIFSHFHQDHIGGFVDYTGVSSLMRYITIESIIYNFPSYRTYMTAHGSANDMNNMRLWYEKRIPALREKGTTIYQARTGQKYYFGNAEIEILWTYDDIAPFNIFEDRTNPTSIGFTVTIEGQKIMLTGDSSEEEFRMVAAKYGDYLKCDFLQLSHHGGGNGAGMHNFYTLVNAPVIFWPNPSDDYPTWIGANEKLEINSDKLVIRSGNYGIATLKLPFTVGDTIVSTNVPEVEAPAEE